MANPLDLTRSRRPVQVHERKQHQVHVTDAQAQLLAADYAAGATLAVVSAKYRVDPETAARHIKRAGVPTRRFEIAVPASELPQVYELRAQGTTFREIGQLYGCSCTAAAAPQCVTPYFGPRAARGSP